MNKICKCERSIRLSNSFPDLLYHPFFCATERYHPFFAVELFPVEDDVLSQMPTEPARCQYHRCRELFCSSIGGCVSHFADRHRESLLFGGVKLRSWNIGTWREQIRIEFLLFLFGP